MDKAKFKYFVEKQNMTLTALALKMGMNPATLSKKLGGMSEFTRKEIQDYQRITQTSDAEMLSIFFN